jgi:hypothetical protein
MEASGEFNVFFRKVLKVSIFGIDSNRLMLQENLFSSVLQKQYDNDRMKIVGWTLPLRKCEEAQEEAGSACGILLHACGKRGPSLFAQEDRLKASAAIDSGSVLEPQQVGKRVAVFAVFNKLQCSRCCKRTIWGRSYSPESRRSSKYCTCPVYPSIDG